MMISATKAYNLKPLKAWMNKIDSDACYDIRDAADFAAYLVDVGINNLEGFSDAELLRYLNGFNRINCHGDAIDGESILGDWLNVAIKYNLSHDSKPLDIKRAVRAFQFDCDIDGKKVPGDIVSIFENVVDLMASNELARLA